MKTIGDVVKKMKEEGQDEGIIHLHKKYVRHGWISLSLGDLEKISPDLDIEKYVNEQDEEDIDWSCDGFEQVWENEETAYPLEFDDVEIGI